VRQLPVPPTVLPGVTSQNTVLNRNTTEWYIYPPTYVHTHYANPSEPSGCYVRYSEILRFAHTAYLCVCTDLRTNSVHSPIQH
jgi:hypothetical protein